MVAISISNLAFCPPESFSTGISTISLSKPAAPRRVRNAFSVSSGRSRKICCKALSLLSAHRVDAGQKINTQLANLKVLPAIRGSLSAINLTRLIYLRHSPRATLFCHHYPAANSALREPLVIITNLPLFNGQAAGARVAGSEKKTQLPHFQTGR